MVAKDKLLPQVGVGLIVRHKGKVLLRKRNKSHGKGTWQFVGGHLELGESLENCAKREALEEVGIKVKNLELATITNDIFSNKKHYITVFMVCDYLSGKISSKEKDKSGYWDWFFWDNLPKPLFLPIKNLLKQNFSPF